MPVQIVIDDDSTASDLSYTGTQWSVNRSAVSAYNQTITVCNTNNDTINPVLSFNFYGSELALYGPPAGANVRASYIIDRSSRRAINFANGTSTAQHGLKLWSIENMDTAYHDLKLFPEAGAFSFDFLLIAPNKYSSPTGRKLIVDEGDSQIEYSSGWSAPNNGTMESILAQGVPFGGGVKGTNSVGENLTFNFTGSSVSVFGLLNQQAGRLSFSYSVDNSTSETVTPFDGTQTANNAWRLNQEFFRKDLGPGKHSMSLQLLEASGSQMLWLDYLTFEGTSSTVILPTTTGGPLDPTATSTSRSKLNNSQITAIVIVVFIIFCACFFSQKLVEYSRRHRQRRHEDECVGTNHPTESVAERPIIVVVPPSNQPSTIIHNHPYTGTHVQQPPANPVVMTYHHPGAPARDGGPAEAPPPPYNPNV